MTGRTSPLQRNKWSHLGTWLQHRPQDSWLECLDWPVNNFLEWYQYCPPWRLWEKSEQMLAPTCWMETSQVRSGILEEARLVKLETTFLWLLPWPDKMGSTMERQLHSPRSSWFSLCPPTSSVIAWDSSKLKDMPSLGHCCGAKCTKIPRLQSPLKPMEVAPSVCLAQVCLPWPWGHKIVWPQASLQPRIELPPLWVPMADWSQRESNVVRNTTRRRSQSNDFVSTSWTRMTEQVMSKKLEDRLFELDTLGGNPGPVVGSSVTSTRTCRDEVPRLYSSLMMSQNRPQFFWVLGSGYGTGGPWCPLR